MPPRKRSTAPRKRKAAEEDVGPEESSSQGRKSIPASDVALPSHCETLCKFFTALDSIVTVFGLRKVPCFYENVKGTVEASAQCGDFKGVHLAQIKYLSPELLYVRLEGLENAEMKKEMNLLVDIHRQIGKASRGGKSISIDTATKEVAERRVIFREKAIRYVERYHKSFLDGLSPEGREYPETTYWHPLFNLDSVPSVPEADIPRPPGEIIHDSLNKDIPLDKPGTIYKPMTVPEIVDYIQNHAYYANQIVHIQTIEPRLPQFSTPKEPLSTYVMEALKQNGVTRLYSHQTDAINAVYEGYECVVISASTSSGKSLIYNIPALQAIERDYAARSIYLFPTKALAQDQLRVLRGYFPYAETTFSTYDGDTVQKDRITLRGDARIILTNPDMLHVGMIPNHRLWAECLANLRFIVIDELHYYRGIFGSHVAQIIRRLRRLCRHYGSNPQFILCSATISNPLEHASRLTGIPLADPTPPGLCVRKGLILIDRDGSPRGRRTMVFWNPAIINKEKNERRSTHIEATHIFVELLKHNFRAISFCKTKSVTELLLSYSRDRLKIEKKELVELIRSYRAGYTAEIRRQIERDLFTGKLMGVTATNALELGVDIGSLDATISVGYPGSIASFWQQVGRCGRGTRDSVSFLVGYESPLDQYFMQNAGEVFSRPHECVVIDPENVCIMEKHTLCAAKELDIGPQDCEMYGASLVPVVEEQHRAGLMAACGDSCFRYARDDFPSQKFGIRSASAKRFAVVLESTGAVLEEVEEGLAHLRIHPGAILLNQGDAYEVLSLSHEAMAARVRAVRVNYFTRPRSRTSVLPVDVVRTSPVFGPHSVSFGRVDVRLSVLGYSKIYEVSQLAYENIDLDLPSTRFTTKGVWIDLSRDIMVSSQLGTNRSTRYYRFLGGIHAIAHVLESVVPLFVITDPGDVHVVCPRDEAATGSLSSSASASGPGRIMIYDGCEGGAGLCERVFHVAAELLRAVSKALAGCGCAGGCPSCVHSPKCSSHNVDVDKDAACRIIQQILGPGENDAVQPEGCGPDK